MVPVHVVVAALLADQGMVNMKSDKYRGSYFGND